MESSFDIMWSLYKSMDFPQMPLEESIKHSEAKMILHHACLHLMRAEGIIE